MLLGLEAPTVRPAFDVRAVAAVVGLDGEVALGIDTDGPWNRQQRERVLERQGAEVHVLEQRRGLGLGSALHLAELDVGAEAASLGEDRESRGRVSTELAVLARCVEELERPFDRQFIGERVVGNGRSLFTALEVGAVLSRPNDDHLTVLISSEDDGVDRSGIDLIDVSGDCALEANALGLGARGVVAEVEATEPGQSFFLTTGDGVEVVFHRGGEVVVDEVAEVLLEQRDDGEGDEGGDERRPLLPDVATVLDGGDDAGVGGRSTNAELFHLLDQ